MRRKKGKKNVRIYEKKECGERSKTNRNQAMRKRHETKNKAMPLEPLTKIGERK